MAVKFFSMLMLAAGLLVLAKALQGQVLADQRQDFLRAEKFLEQGHDEAYLELADRLTDYPLYPHLQYEWLKRHMQKSDKVKAYLQRYADTRYAQPLLERWLDYLAKHERWPEFIAAYQDTGNASHACHYYWALLQTGQKPQALAGAQQLWLTGTPRPGACLPLFNEFTASSVFTRDLLWQRFALAVSAENTELLVFLRRFMDKAEQKTADFWLRVHKNPYLVKDSGLWVGAADPWLGRIFAEGVVALAATDLNLALQLWDGRKQYLAIDKLTLAETDKKLALLLFARQDARAYQRLSLLPQNDPQIRETRIRTALYQQDWRLVLSALSDLPWAVQQEPAWQYWRARALAELGRKQEADVLYLKLAADRSFYGFLAADHLGGEYALNDKPVTLTAQEIDDLLQTPEFKPVAEWRYWQREAEAQRQWRFALERLSGEPLKIAAKLAQQWQWDQLAIATLVKAGYWDDLGVRFPIRYETEIKANAGRLALEPAMLLALMRQESQLDTNALSPVGAKGLLQLMPATAQDMAVDLGEVWQGDGQLFSPAPNIRYGSQYFANLLKRFRGHVALAVAAYNAGPNRVAKWLPSQRSVPADVWVETIPYKETRKYVTAVLTYAIIYHYRLQAKTIKINTLLADVPAN